MKRFLTILFVVLLAAIAYASSMQEGPPLKGEVVAAEMTDQEQKNWELSVKLLEEPYVAPSGYYDASEYKLGTKVKVIVDRSSQTFKKGDKVTICWRSYSAMGAEGPVGGLSWRLISKP
jgi:hypothetical protein